MKSKKSAKTKFRLADIGETNKFENFYVILFVLSIFAGMIYGVANAGYYQPFEERGALELQEGENNFTIFYRNFLLSLIDLVTAGLAGIYFTFQTFAVSASYFYSQGIIFALFFLYVYGAFELLGALVFGLVGFSFAERIFRVKSKLKVKNLFLLGVLLMFLASIIEYGFILLLRAL